MYKLYNELREAPGVCGKLAQELFQLWGILDELENTISMKKAPLSGVNRARLEEYASSCKELCMQILGATTISCEGCGMTGGCDMTGHTSVSTPVPVIPTVGIFKNIGGRLGQMRLARKFPEFRRAVSAQIEMLTAFNVLLIRSAHTQKKSRA